MRKKTSGIPKNVLNCYDGDPSCDLDGSFTNNSCSVRAQLCINNTDARLPNCDPSSVHTVEIIKPNPNSLDPSDSFDVTALEAALGMGGFGVTVARNGIIVQSGMANATPNLCGAPFMLKVPLRLSPAGKAKNGQRSFKLRAATSFGFLDTDSVKVRCLASTCGNSRIEADHETCDDGNRLDGDGCDHSCHIEPHTPTPTPTPTQTPTPYNCPPGVDCGVYEVQPGSGLPKPVDDGTSSYLKLTDVSGLNLIDNATNGAFNNAAVILTKQAENVDGIAPLMLAETIFVGAPLPALAQ
ncbi:MAG: hypothetical protein HY270_20945, partial [Deltaproteobacteria bacterium]|nr:hypothetical protein [Deltaproteobacteria bacterium]